MLLVRISVLALGAGLVSFAFVVAGTNGPGVGGSSKDDSRLAALNKWLGDFPEVPKEGLNRETVAIDAPIIRRLLPGYGFYCVIFYKDAPHPGPLSQPLNLHNLFAVLPAGDVVQFKDKEHLAAFLESKLPPLQGDDQIRDAALACLHLAEGVFQDGHYEFKVEEPVSIKHDCDHVIAIAKSLAQKRDRGGVTVTLTVADTGKVTKVELQSAVRPTAGRRR